MDRKKRNELLLIGAIVLLVLLSFAGIRFAALKDAAVVEVSIDGQVYKNYPITKNVDEILTGQKGGTNHLVIQNGGVSITEASCPDKVCVHQGIIKETGQTLVCLPNKVTVTIK